MAEYEIAFKQLMINEGIYSDNPNDPGGPTKYGITLPFLKEAGPEHGDINGDGSIDLNDIRALDLDSARKIYSINRWNKFRYFEIVDQLVATKVFDASVLLGYYRAHLILQRALRACGVNLKHDGILGPKTRAATNITDPAILLPALRAEYAGMLRSVALKYPNLEEFLPGWLNRAYERP